MIYFLRKFGMRIHLICLMTLSYGFSICLHFFGYYESMAWFYIETALVGCILFAFSLNAIYSFPRNRHLKFRIGIAGATMEGLGYIVFFMLGIQHGLVFFLPEYSTTLSRLFVISSLILCGFSLWRTFSDPKFKRIDISRTNGPHLKIIHLSDLHLGALKSIRWLEKIVMIVQQQSPDLICITGDLFNRSEKNFSDFIPILSQLKAKRGVFMVLGNHDQAYATSFIKDTLKNTEIKWVTNRLESIDDRIELIGVDNDLVENAVKDQTSRQRLLDLFSEASPSKITLYLSHQPLHFNNVASSPIDLQLSGHYHAGQLPPYDILVLSFIRYAYGLFQKKQTYLYTTAGVGSWDIPVRFLMPAEIVEIRI